MQARKKESVTRQPLPEEAPLDDLPPRTIEALRELATRTGTRRLGHDLLGPAVLLRHRHLLDDRRHGEHAPHLARMAALRECAAGGERQGRECQYRFHKRSFIGARLRPFGDSSLETRAGFRAAGAVKLCKCSSQAPG